MKILYAATNNYGSKIQLSRFLEAMQGSKHQIKIAAYKKSSPKNISIDWTLDALLNIYKPELLSLNNDNIEIYLEQIKNYTPDLIISDLEYFTSYLANVINIPLWQCSSSLINHALTRNEKYDLGLFKNYAHALNRDPAHTARTANIITNSNHNLVYSHYADTVPAPILQDNFEWIRPYHKVHRLHIPCRHDAVAGLSNNNKQILNFLKNYSEDNVVFLDSNLEKYQDIHLKDIDMEDEYYCNLRNCNLFICQGQACFLADAFYNGKFPIIYPDYNDTESIINSHLSDKLSLGMIYQDSINFININKTIFPIYNNSIMYLHEKIEKEF